MQGLRLADGTILYDANGVPVGVMGLDGKEYLFPTVQNAASATIQPNVTNNVAITGGDIRGTPIGIGSRSTGSFSAVNVTTTDSTGTPGNVTNNSTAGRAAFAAAGSSVTVTNSSVAATSTVLVTLLGAADATLTNIVGVTVAAGSFTVTGNAAATATKGFMFLVINI